ncbi:unnamed protein product [Symbiodinium sp. KB8]|nr:unnamed protein product [Symbiodinium sp. KB8]
MDWCASGFVMVCVIDILTEAICLTTTSALVFNWQLMLTHQEWREERSILERRVQSLQDELQQCRRGSFDNEVEHQDALLAAQRKAEEASEEAVEAGKLVQMLQLEASEARSRLEASQAQDFSRSSELAELKEARQQLSEQAADATASCESHKQLIRALQQSMAEQSQQAEAELAELRRLADATPTIQRALSSSTPQRKSSAGEWRALLEEEDNEPDGKVDSPSATPADHNSTTKPEEQVVGDVTDSLLEQLESTSGLGSGRLPKGAGAPETAGHEEANFLWVLTFATCFNLRRTSVRSPSCGTVSTTWRNGAGISRRSWMRGPLSTRHRQALGH